jgi:hypothetical protein
MARSVDVVNTSSQAQGFNMVTMNRTAHAHPSLNQGTYMSGLADASATSPPAAGSPGACLGTGMNVDIYTPSLEA